MWRMIIKEKLKIIGRNIIISIVIATVLVGIFHKKMFECITSTSISDWSQCVSWGYKIDGNKFVTITSDPCIYFVAPNDIYKIDIDIKMIESTELLVNERYDGQKAIYAELFYADENGQISSANSIPFNIKEGEDTYTLTIECPANTLFRLDIADGKDVTFYLNTIVFYTREEFTDKEKNIACIMLASGIFVAISLYWFINYLKKDKTS